LNDAWQNAAGFVRQCDIIAEQDKTAIKQLVLWPFSDDVGKRSADGGEAGRVGPG
jgi:hypothetical protein